MKIRKNMNIARLWHLLAIHRSKLVYKVLLQYCGYWESLKDNPIKQVCLLAVLNQGWKSKREENGKMLM